MARVLSRAPDPRPADRRLRARDGRSCSWARGCSSTCGWSRTSTRRSTTACARGPTTSRRSCATGGRGRAAVGRARLTEDDEAFAQVLTPAGRLLDSTPGVRRAGARRRRGPAANADRADSARARVPGIEATARLLAREVEAPDGSGRDRRRRVARGPRRDARRAAQLVPRGRRRGGARGVACSATCWPARGLAPIEAMRRRAERVSLDRRRRAAAAAGRARRGPAARRDAQRDARPAPGVVRARAALRGRREPRAAHPARGAEDRARGGAAAGRPQPRGAGVARGGGRGGGPAGAARRGPAADRPRGRPGPARPPGDHERSRPARARRPALLRSRPRAGARRSPSRRRTSSRPSSIRCAPGRRSET